MLKLTSSVVVVMLICGQATSRPQFMFPGFGSFSGAGGAGSFSSAGGIGSFSGAGGGAGVFTGTGGRPGVFTGTGGFGGFGMPFYQPQFNFPQINFPDISEIVAQASKDGEVIQDDKTGTNFQSYFVSSTSDGKNPPKTVVLVNDNGKKIVKEY